MNAKENLEKLMKFSLQYCSTKLGYILNNKYHDLTTSQGEVLVLWSNYPDLYLEDFRSALQETNTDIKQDTNLLVMFKKFFLFVRSTQFMSSDEILFSIDTLLSVFNSSICTEFGLLKNLRELVEKGEESNLDEMKRKLTYLLCSVNRFIFPIFSDNHSSYGCCEKINNSTYRIAIFNGGIGFHLFHSKLSSNAMGCCIANMGFDECSKVLNASAEYYNKKDIFQIIATSFDWDKNKFDPRELMVGGIAEFSQLEITMELQEVGNCVLFNLICALRYANRTYPKYGEVYQNLNELQKKAAVVNYALKEIIRLYFSNKMHKDKDIEIDIASVSYAVEQLRQLRICLDSEIAIIRRASRN